MQRLLLFLLALLLIVQISQALNPTSSYKLSDIFPSAVLVPQGTAQSIAASDVIAADHCGGFKLISAAGAVATDATNAFTASTTGGCWMMVCNVSSGANTITIKHSTAVLTSTGSDLALAKNGCVAFGSDGTTWYQLVTMLTNS